VLSMRNCPGFSFSQLSSYYHRYRPAKPVQVRVSYPNLQGLFGSEGGSVVQGYKGERMGALSILLVGLLPLVFTTQVFFYHPLPQATFVQPLVYSLPSILPPSMGNRKHELFPKHTYVGNRKYDVFPRSQESTTYHSCRDLTADWQQWETGATGSIRIKRGKQDAFTSDWEVDMVFDKPLSNLEVYNGVVDQSSGSKFKVTGTSWNARLAPGEDVKINFKATFEPNELAPSLTGLVVNGKYHDCKPPKKPPTTRMSSHPAWPSKILGLYILLADDVEDGFDSKAEWQPQLYEWQQEASNVLFFTFIHPDTMEIPPSFKSLAATRGTGTPGSVPADTVIMFAIGGYSYSIKPNPWHWLTSKEAAEEMAEKVAKWPEMYGCDGIDLDLEEGAGSNKIAGPNMVHFIRKLKELNPNIIVSQPTYGYPQVQAEIDVINASWDSNGKSSNLADSIGLMVYEGTQALNYVKNYANGAGQWQGFPVQSRAPKNVILLGAKGASSSATINKLAKEVVKEDLLGIMVWYASVKNGFDYAPVWDASTHNDAISGYKSAMQLFRQVTGAPKPTKPAPVVTTPAPTPEAEAPSVAPVVSEIEQESPQEITQSSTGHPAWPNKIMGLYVLLADDTEDGFGTNADWDPKLFKWQQEASNVLFFTFIHPDSMEVPLAYQKLAATRGSGTPGSVPADTVIMFAIGGYAYSIKPNPWKWLTSQAAAEEMAVKVAKWPELYGCDGIDLDLEEGAGSNKIAGKNMVHFIRKLKQLNPNIIVSQPTYGWPQVQAEIDVINASWNSKGESQNLADSIGLMVYQGTQSLNYVKNYDSSKRWQGHPVSASVPNNAILLGAKGVTSSSDIIQLAQTSVKDDLLGIMVWYASVDNGFQYKQSSQWDASINDDAIKGYKEAMKILKQGQSAIPRIYY